MAFSFPHPSTAQEDGLLAVGADLSVQTLINAYTSGIFPWPYSPDEPILWFSPDPRGVIETKNLHISKSMQRLINKKKYTVIFNKNFEKVIDSCALVKRKDQSSTWIDSRIKKGYLELFKNKLAYSAEVYNQDQQLVGGLYGTCFGEMISGESMFHLESNCSKLALIAVITRLKECEITLMDTQMVTDVVESIGAAEIPRTEFLKHIASVDFSKKRELIFKND